MKISEIPTLELKRILAATARALGPHSSEARAIQREMDRREQQKSASDLRTAEVSHAR
jgi:hypothetical protein